MRRLAGLGLGVVLAGCSSSSSGSGVRCPSCGGSDALPPPMEGGGTTGPDAAGGDATPGDAGEAGDAADVRDARADAGPLADYASGTRLRAEVYETAEGAKLWHGWYDSTLSASCTFRQGEDGMTRCLPVDSYVQFFTDTQCSVPVGATGTGCTAPKYVGYEPSGCNLMVYKAGAKLGAGTALYQRSGTSCVSATTAVDVYPLTHVDPTTLVAAAETSDPRTTALGADYLRADDGALQPLGSYDLARGAGCAPQVAAYASVCAPKDLIFDTQGVYSDPQCTTRLAQKFDGACGLSRATVDLETIDSCRNTTIALYALGALAPTTIYTRPAATCTATTTPTGYSSYALGASIPATSLPGVATTDVGTGRIVTRYQTALTGEKLTPLTWLDTQLGDVCTVRGTASGLRCVPGQDSQELYADGMCMNPIAFVSRATGCPSPPAPKFVTWGGTIDACGNETGIRLLQVGSGISLPMGTFGPGPPCGSSPIDPNGLDIYSATEVDPTTLPAVTDVTE